MQVPQQLLEVVCLGSGQTEVVLDDDCDHFGSNIGPGVPPVNPIHGLVTHVEPGLAGLGVVEEGGGK